MFRTNAHSQRVIRGKRLSQESGRNIREIIEATRRSLRYRSYVAATLDSGILCGLLLVLLQATVHFDLLEIPQHYILSIALGVGTASLIIRLISIVRRTATDEAITILWSNGDDRRISELILSALELASQQSLSQVPRTTQALIQHQLDYVESELSSSVRNPNMPSIWTRWRALFLSALLGLLVASVNVTEFWRKKTDGFTSSSDAFLGQRT